jgi:hypothetical protein
VLRGALGFVLQNSIFRPTSVLGPSGLADPPRPFVIRAAHLDGCTIPAGSPFSFNVHCFEMRHAIVDQVTQAFARFPQAELTSVTGGDAPLALSLTSLSEPVDRVTVRFVTPTELKTDGGLAERPEFGVLASRIRDRVSSLRERYDDGPLDIDFRAFGERAARVRMTRCDLRQVDVSRRSSRTGQVHSIGGFVGEADYEGDLAEFVPYLQAAAWTGVGRQTVWGKGALETCII